MASFSVINGAIRLRKFGGKYKAGIKYPISSAEMYAALKPLVTLGDVLLEVTAAEEATFEKKLAGASVAKAPEAPAAAPASAPAAPATVPSNESKDGSADAGASTAPATAPSGK